MAADPGLVGLATRLLGAVIEAAASGRGARYAARVIIARCLTEVGHAARAEVHRALRALDADDDGRPN